MKKNFSSTPNIALDFDSQKFINQQSNGNTLKEFYKEKEINKIQNQQNQLLKSVQTIQNNMKKSLTTTATSQSKCTNKSKKALQSTQSTLKNSQLTLKVAQSEYDQNQQKITQYQEFNNPLGTPLSNQALSHKKSSNSLTKIDFQDFAQPQSLVEVATAAIAKSSAKSNQQHSQLEEELSKLSMRLQQQNYLQQQQFQQKQQQQQQQPQEHFSKNDLFFKRNFSIPQPQTHSSQLNAQEILSTQSPQKQKLKKQLYNQQITNNNNNNNNKESVSDEILKILLNSKLSNSPKTDCITSIPSSYYQTSISQINNKTLKNINNNQKNNIKNYENFNNHPQSFSSNTKQKKLSKTQQNFSQIQQHQGPLNQIQTPINKIQTRKQQNLNINKTMNSKINRLTEAYSPKQVFSQNQQNQQQILSIHQTYLNNQQPLTAKIYTGNNQNQKLNNKTISPQRDNNKTNNIFAQKQKQQRDQNINKKIQNQQISCQTTTATVKTQKKKSFTGMSCNQTQNSIQYQGTCPGGGSRQQQQNNRFGSSDNKQDENETTGLEINKEYIFNSNENGLKGSFNNQSNFNPANLKINLMKKNSDSDIMNQLNYSKDRQFMSSQAADTTQHQTFALSSPQGTINKDLIKILSQKIGQIQTLIQEKSFLLNLVNEKDTQINSLKLNLEREKSNQKVQQQFSQQQYQEQSLNQQINDFEIFNNNSGDADELDLQISKENIKNNENNNYNLNMKQQFTQNLFKNQNIKNIFESISMQQNQKNYQSNNNQGLCGVSEHLKQYMDNFKKTVKQKLDNYNKSQKQLNIVYKKLLDKIFENQDFQKIQDFQQFFSQYEEICMFQQFQQNSQIKYQNQEQYVKQL